MTIRAYVNSAEKRTETTALVDCGATENFINTDHTYAMRLPLKRLTEPREVFNVDKTPNRQGPITHYTDLMVRTGTKMKKMHFFLTHLGGNPIILGYPWFAAMEPRITWAKGWIDYDDLPITLSPTTEEDPMPLTQIKQTIIVTLAADDRRTMASKLAEQHQTIKSTTLPTEYQRHAQVFSEEKAQHFPESRVWDHAIELKADAPATLPGKIYALTQEERKALRTFIEEHLRKGYITPSKSPYAAPFFFIKKKDGKLRPVQDYRHLNEHTIRNRYPLPLIPELISRVQNAALFSKFDVRWGYNNIRIKKQDQWKAAFITNEGLFELRVMFFRLTNSPATFQTMMNAIFAEELRQEWLTIYIDDILVHMDEDKTLHQQRVHQVLHKLARHDLFLKPKKCQFEQTSVEFLGVILSKGTVQMDPAKLKGIADWSPPKCVKDVRSFLGFTGFYQYFVPNYSRIARPLIQLTQKNTPFHWWEPHMKAFETLKTLMCRQPILQQPDYNKRFFLATDASSYSVGAVLSQEGEINPRTHKIMRHPIAYYSAMFTPTERNYDIFKRELLALMKALHHWRPHIAATETPVTVLTDHANLTHWKVPRRVNRRVARWFRELQEYNLEIKHVPGKLHMVADMLSRPPVEDRGEQDNNDLTLLPEEMFIRLQTDVTPEPEYHDLMAEVARTQNEQKREMKEWETTHHIDHSPSDDYPTQPQWFKGHQVVVPSTNETRREIMRYYHDAPTTGHPGRDETIQAVKRTYWWPNMNKWIADYVKGCAPC